MKLRRIFTLQPVKTISTIPLQENSRNSAHQSLQNLLLIAQVFGLMPISGITSGKIEYLKFNWLTYQTAYASLHFLGAVLMTILQVLKMETVGSSLSEMRLLGFFIFGMLSSISFFNLAKRWPILMKKWHTLETTFQDYGLPRLLYKTLNLYLAIYLMIALAQFFGIMPLSVIHTGQIIHLEFKWYSINTIYAILRLAGAIFISILQLVIITNVGWTLKEVRILIFFISGVLTSVNFLVLAKNWKYLIKNIQKVEFEMLEDYGWPYNLNLNVNSTFVVYMIAAILEHCLEVIHKILLIQTCGMDFSSSVEIFLKYFILKDVFTVINYSIFWGILFEVITVLLTFSWTFIDIFIILLSLCLTARFTQISCRVKFLAKTKVDNEKAWEKVRKDYCKLCNLCRILDHEISFIILQSFASNMFFILTQLFNSFQTKVFLMEKVYFCFSFVSLILRMFLVCFTGGRVYEESMKPLITLSEVSSSIYNSQIQRFAEYIHWNNVSLTGRHYFTIRRGLVLQIAGAIITYELVLLQFNGHILSQDYNETSIFNCNDLLGN